MNLLSLNFLQRKLKDFSPQPAGDEHEAVCPGEVGHLVDVALQLLLFSLGGDILEQLLHHVFVQPLLVVHVHHRPLNLFLCQLVPGQQDVQVLGPATFYQGQLLGPFPKNARGTSTDDLIGPAPSLSSPSHQAIGARIFVLVGGKCFFKVSHVYGRMDLEIERDREEVV